MIFAFDRSHPRLFSQGKNPIFFSFSFFWNQVWTTTTNIFFTEHVFYVSYIHDIHQSNLLTRSNKPNQSKDLFLPIKIRTIIYKKIQFTKPWKEGGLERNRDFFRICLDKRSKRLEASRSIGQKGQRSPRNPGGIREKPR